MKIPYVEDRHEPNPLERKFICPISGEKMLTIPYRVHKIQEEFLNASTKKERTRILAEFCLKNGLGSDNPECWRAIHKDFIAPLAK